MKQLEVSRDYGPSPLPRRAYTMRETSEILGTSYMSVWRLAKRGLLRPSKALRIKLFSAEEIERFLRETI
jgi:hypothetical protein